MADEEKRFFTVAEANALLPEVRRVLHDLRRAMTGLETMRSRLAPADAEGFSRPSPDTTVDPERFLLISLFHASLGRFGELGIEVKDAQRGLIDFPALLEGAEVRLCWLEGEDAVLYYHDLESGFAGRKPIESFTPPPKDEEPEDEG